MRTMEKNKEKQTISPPSVTETLEWRRAAAQQESDGSPGEILLKTDTNVYNNKEL